MPWNNVRRGSCPSSFEKGAPIVRSGSCSSRVITEATEPELTLDDRFTFALDHRAARPCPSSFRSRLNDGTFQTSVWQRCSCAFLAPASLRVPCGLCECVASGFLPHVKLWCLGACVKFGFARREFLTCSTGPRDEASVLSNPCSMCVPSVFYLSALVHRARD